MKILSKVFVAILFLALKIYRKTLKITGMYYFIRKNNLLFNLYVIPARLYVVLKRIILEGYPLRYIWDIFSKNYLKIRKGNCKQCGDCCFGCASLVEKDGKKICGVYSRRDWCDVYFPVTKYDLENISRMYNCDCGFYFD